MASDSQTDDTKKTKRVRKKRLYAAIMNQMEFYFSDANLTRDKYLRSLMEKDKFIPLSEFVKFARIRSLSASLDDLVHALSGSQFLQLSSDGSAVCRRSPFVFKEDAELCTIYVESIPRSSGREALRRTFSAYGTVDSISLPTHRATGHHRGFGFVQFRTPNMANNALYAFGALGRRMPSEHYPEYLTAVEPAPDDTEPLEEGGEGDGEEVELAPVDPPPAAAPDLTSRPGKRKLSTDSSSRDAPMKMTRFADTPESEKDSTQNTGAAQTTGATATGSASATPADTDNSNFSEGAADGTTSCSEPHREDASLATSLLTERTDDTDLSGGERRARRHRRTRRGRKAPLNETEDTRLLGLQIMPLSEWSRFKEQYRALQKENMSEIKRALQEQNANRPRNPPARPVGVAPQFVPGTVVRFSADRPAAASDKQLISALKSRPGVQYVELGADSEPSYLRMESAAAAAACLKDPELRDAAVLTGGDEENYWRRLREERSATRSRRHRSKERGRDRLLRRLRTSEQLES
ncbi:la-related protein 7-like [Amphibalanus amphitrite]|uniref:la-related protein 7-like n=1 Tax=Amphibalanus amphitrite TaxID=1232801 RepID=UPI001C8FBF88|nr:la-related protein 7-like [Amphibalanus amphitrite]XP_043198957.1 la-related protein 7-like [Amphibalanus amphitrite]XP_043198958.1 la-related protein 7-like [Amphibalanus amphitrite]